MLEKIATKWINQPKILLLKRNLVIKMTNIQEAFTCAKSATVTPEGAKHAK